MSERRKLEAAIGLTEQQKRFIGVIAAVRVAGFRCCGIFYCGSRPAAVGGHFWYASRPGCSR
jgi:hypothetical protein